MESHSDIADAPLAIHGLSGADAVASFHGIGKATVVKEMDSAKYGWEIYHLGILVTRAVPSGTLSARFCTVGHITAH